MKNKIEDLKSTIQELIELFEEQNLEHWAEMYKRRGRLRERAKSYAKALANDILR
jgi:hypothetical protein